MLTIKIILCWNKGFQSSMFKTICLKIFLILFNYTIVFVIVKLFIKYILSILMSDLKPLSTLSEEKGYLKISVENITLKNSLIDKGFLQTKVDGNGKEPINAKFDEKIASIMEFYIFSVTNSSSLRFQLVSLDKKQVYGECEFSINKFCYYPKIRHSLDIELAKKQNVQNADGGTSVKFTAIGNIKVEVLYLNGKLGNLEIKQTDINVYSGVTQPYQVVISIGNESAHITSPKQFEKLKIWAAQTIMEVTVYDQGQKNVIGFKQIDLYEENLLRPSKNFHKRPIYISHKGKTIGNLLISSRFMFKKFTEQVQQLI